MIFPTPSEKNRMLQNYSSQIIIIFKEEEEEHRDIDPEISNWMKTVFHGTRRMGIEKHLFPQAMERVQEADGSLFLLW